MPTLWSKTFNTLLGVLPVGEDIEVAKLAADAAIFALANADADVLYDQRIAAAEKGYWSDPMCNARWTGRDTGIAHGPVDLREYFAAVARQYGEVYYVNGSERAVSLPTRDWVRVAFAMIECPAGVDVYSDPTNAECDYVYSVYLDSI